MANQLAIPFRKTNPIPIREAVYDYIRANHPDTHPETFKWDVERWQQLRADAISDTEHVSRAKALISYYAQLTYALTKLPYDIGLNTPYSAALNTSAPSVSIPNLAYERASILFNLAALYSQLAVGEDRSHPDGIKRANAYYQNAAGTLNFLISSLLPSLLQSLPHGIYDPELSEALLRSLEYLMLAQAQECAWQKAVMDHLKNGIVAKLAAKVTSFYEMSASTIRDSTVSHAFPKEWLAHVDTKSLHFEAATQYRKSMDDVESNRYGHELARLLKAKEVAKSGYDLARRNYVAKPVLEDVKSVMDIINTNITRAERDNDLIYHYDVPSFSQLQPVQEITMVKSTIPPGLQDCAADINQDGLIFGDLVGWGAKVAIDIYKERVNNWLKSEVFNKVEELDTLVDQTLQELTLPAAIDALDQPSRLPPNILKKAEEVRLDAGPDRIEGSLENLELLHRHCRSILEEAMDILDQEASEDEGARKSGRSLDRLPSHEANAGLTAAEARYRQMLEHSGESDVVIRGKWEEWEESITRLMWDEDDIEHWVPSSAPSGSSSTAPDFKARSAAHTQARALRVHLEALDDLRSKRASLAQRARRLAAADDITPRITHEAAALARWDEVSPARFEGALDAEMSKYDKFKTGAEESAESQATLLEQVRKGYAKFVEERQEDERVREREYALQSLDLAYHKYCEIIRDLGQGLEFYNNLATILARFKESCRDWVRSRRDEMRALSQTFDALRLRDRESAIDGNANTPTPSRASSTINAPHPSTQVRPKVKAGLGASTPKAEAPSSLAQGAAEASDEARPSLELPPPDSDDWEDTPLPVPRMPGPGPLRSLAAAGKGGRQSS